MLSGKHKDAVSDDGAQPVSYEIVAEFLRARQKRIAVRRARIAQKLADRFVLESIFVSCDYSSYFSGLVNFADLILSGNVDKRKQDNQNELSAASSLDFLTGPEDAPILGGDDVRLGSAGAEAGHGSVAGKSASNKAKAAKDGRSSAEADASTDMKRSGADPLDIQIEESRKQLEQIILDGEALITNVRVAVENREKLRHAKATESRKERIDRLNSESQDCQTLYDELKPNFDVTTEKTLPLDLFQKVKGQMQACEELLMKKQDLIQDLQMEIEENDFEFEQSLEMYQKDVSLIGDRIDDNVDELQTAFLNELNLVEDYTCQNRETILKENQAEWMDLLEDFQIMEENHLGERKSDAINKFQNLNELYITTKQECRAMRHKFEDDCRILIEEREQIKYATQLNMEKLQYNLTIIRKRFKENVEMKNMMKRLLLKFNDRFTTKSKALKQKMEAGKKEAKKILHDIAKLDDSVSQFGKKTLHLAVSDWNKYMDLWAVSEEMVRDRVQRLVGSEKYIFETQLGIDSPLPDLSFMDDRPEVVTKYMIKKSRRACKALKIQDKEEGEEEANEEEEEGDSVKTSSSSLCEEVLSSDDSVHVTGSVVSEEEQPVHKTGSVVSEEEHPLEESVHETESVVPEEEQHLEEPVHETASVVSEEEHPLEKSDHETEAVVPEEKQPLEEPAHGIGSAVLEEETTFEESIPVTGLVDLAEEATFEESIPVAGDLAVLEEEQIVGESGAVTGPGPIVSGEEQASVESVHVTGSVVSEGQSIISETEMETSEDDFAAAFGFAQEIRPKITAYDKPLLSNHIPCFFNYD